MHSLVLDFLRLKSRERALPTALADHEGQLRYSRSGDVTGKLKLARHIIGGTYAFVDVPSVLTGSKSFDWANILNGAEATTTVTVTGAVLGDPAVAAMDKDLQAMKITAHVSAADTVTVVLRNDTGGAIDLASGTLRAVVFKQ